jgi:hypothetical protein
MFTAIRDIINLIGNNNLQKEPTDGRSTGYELRKKERGLFHLL